MHLALRVLATLRGTDFCASILGASGAAIYTAYYMQSEAGSARKQIVAEAYGASRERTRPLHGRAWEGVTGDQYYDLFWDVNRATSQQQVHRAD